MPDQQKPHKSTIRFTPERYDWLRSHAFERKWTFQQIIETALDEYMLMIHLHGNAPSPLPGHGNSTVPGSISPSEGFTLQDKHSSSTRRAHRLLDLVLESEIEEVRAAIMSNLEAFGLLVGAITGEPKKGSIGHVAKAGRRESVAEITARINRLVDSGEEGTRGIDFAPPTVALKTPRGGKR